MFKVIGSDGKPYGPISEADVRQWLREGRVGGSAHACRAGTSEWRPLSSFPDFADILRPSQTAKDIGAAGQMPPAVWFIAIGNFVVCGTSGLFLLINITSLLRYAADGRLQLGWTFYLAWALVLVSLPVRIASGFGLLRGREWARNLALWFAALMTLHGLSGAAQNGKWLIEHGQLDLVLRAPMWLITNLVNLLMLAFNLVTLVVLARREVRTAFKVRQTL